MSMAMLTVFARGQLAILVDYGMTHGRVERAPPVCPSEWNYTWQSGKGSDVLNNMTL